MFSTGSDWKAREGQTLLTISTAGERPAGQHARSERRRMPPPADALVVSRMFYLQSLNSTAVIDGCLKAQRRACVVHNRFDECPEVQACLLILHHFPQVV